MTLKVFYNLNDVVILWCKWGKRKIKKQKTRAFCTPNLQIDTRISSLPSSIKGGNHYSKLNSFFYTNSWMKSLDVSVEPEWCGKAGQIIKWLASPEHRERVYIIHGKRWISLGYCFGKTCFQGSHLHFSLGLPENFTEMLLGGNSWKAFSAASCLKQGCCQH